MCSKVTKEILYEMTTVRYFTCTDLTIGQNGVYIMYDLNNLRFLLNSKILIVHFSPSTAMHPKCPFSKHVPDNVLGVVPEKGRGGYSHPVGES